ncbi:alpha/beta hydrolase [Sphingopyxis chilensis]
MELAASLRPEIAGTISLRQAVVGGLLDAGKMSPPDLLERENRIILLVHGFNVTQPDADAAYELFEGNLSPDLRGRIVRLYWPGDWGTRADAARGQPSLPSKIISRLAYPFKPRTAERSAQRLRTLLANAFRARSKAQGAKPLEIAVVAHSLGCRLAMEALELIIDSSGTNVDLPLTVLMAAATARSTMIEDGKLTNMIEQLPQLWILHSKSDAVLWGAFRPGQLFDSPLFPLHLRGAVGRQGIPGTSHIKVAKGRWGHGDYWPDADIARAIDAELADQRSLEVPFAQLERILDERIVTPRESRQRRVAPFRSICS